MRSGKLLILSMLVAAVAAWFALDLGQYATLDYLKSSQQAFQHYYAQHPVRAIAIYTLLYVLVTALSLPGAAILTLAGGALFGLLVGTVVVSFASSIGATLAFLVSRYLLRDWVRQHFRARLAAVDAGLGRDGAFYLFSLRLVPLFPFFAVNLLMGLTRISNWTYYWVSQLGMLAATVVYVNAGTRLAAIDSVGGILSPQVLGAFVLLGLFPLAARLLLQRLQARKVYARWRKPASFDRNLIVIGAGAGGLVTAYIAAAVKARVTLVESHKMGGDCLNFGCVPSKALIRTARFLREARDARKLGLASAEVEFDFADVMERVRRVIREVEPHDSVARYTKLGVEVVQGRARIVSPWEVEIDGRRLTTRSIVIAAGAQPIVPAIPGIEESGYVTSDTLWSITRLPRKLVLLGGGPIGCELAQAFACLGSAVTVVEMADRVLSREDADVSSLVAQGMQADGITLLAGHHAVRCEKDENGRRLIVQHDGKESALEFDLLLCAVGRVARTRGYGLEELGIPIAAGRHIETDAYLQTLYPNIYACGDVAGPWQLTHVAAHQAWHAAVNALFGQIKRFKVNYDVIPRCTFSSPEVARVGLSEQEAGERRISFERTVFPLHELDRAIADDATRGFVKVLTAPGTDRILGVTIVGERAGDLLAEYVLAMKHGLGLNKLLATVHAYPTFAEANKQVAGEWKRSHAPQRLLRWVQRYHDWRRGAPASPASPSSRTG